MKSGTAPGLDEFPVVFKEIWCSCLRMVSETVERQF